LPSDARDNEIHFRVGPLVPHVDGPRRQDVAETVEFPRDTEKPDDLRVGLAIVPVPVERGPEIGPVALDDGGVPAQRRFDASHAVEDVVHPLRLRISNERGPQAPLFGARAFGEVEQSGQCDRDDLGGHLRAAYDSRLVQFGEQAPPGVTRIAADFALGWFANRSVGAHGSDTICAPLAYTV